MHRHIEAARLRKQDEHDRDVLHAWYGALFYAQVRAKGRLPKVQEYLVAGKGQRSTRQTLGQQRSALAILSAQFGYPVKWGSGEAKHDG